MTGIGCCSSVGDGVATAWTRNGLDWSDKFKALVKAAAKLPAGCLIDGEAVAIDDDGKPSFQLLQSTLKGGSANLAFYAFDLLVDRGEDIRKLPNIERKQRLAALLEGVSPPILYGDHIVGRGEEMFDAVCKQGGEGIISKRASAPYRGTRTRNWLKIKCIQRQEFVIVGWSESDKRIGFRSLLLAAKDGRKLTYVGKVGTGFSGKLIQDLMDRMEPLAVDKAPVEVPRADRKGAHYIKPKLVAEIAFAEFTDDGILRHPSFVGLREDKPAKEVVREVPKHTESVTKTSKRKPAGEEARRGRRRFRDRDQQPRPRHLPRARPDQERPRRLLRDGRAADHGRCGRPADDRDPLPGGRTGESFFQKHDKRHLRPRREAHSDRGEGRPLRGLSVLRRYPAACSPACRWGRSNSTAGAARSTRSNFPTGWCSTSIPTSGSISKR